MRKARWRVENITYVWPARQVGCGLAACGTAVALVCLLLAWRGGDTASQALRRAPGGAHGVLTVAWALAYVALLSPTLGFVQHGVVCHGLS